jgi:hypothetical protein
MAMNVRYLLRYGRMANDIVDSASESENGYNGKMGHSGKLIFKGIMA